MPLILSLFVIERIDFFIRGIFETFVPLYQAFLITEDLGDNATGKKKRERKRAASSERFSLLLRRRSSSSFSCSAGLRSFGRSSRRIFLCPSTHCFKSRICLFFDGCESLTSSGKPDVTPRRDFRVSCQFLNILLNQLRDSFTVPDRFLPFFSRYRCYPRLENAGRSLSSYTQKRIIFPRTFSILGNFCQFFFALVIDAIHV